MGLAKLLLVGFGFVGSCWRYDSSVFPVNIHPGHESHRWGWEITAHVFSRRKEASNAAAVWCVTGHFTASASANVGDEIS